MNPIRWLVMLCDIVAIAAALIIGGLVMLFGLVFIACMFSYHVIREALLAVLGPRRLN